MYKSLTNHRPLIVMSLIISSCWGSRSKRVQLECHHDIEGPKPIHGLVLGTEFQNRTRNGLSGISTPGHAVLWMCERAGGAFMAG